MKLTVTLPTRGRPALLAQALRALTANTEDKTNTVVVVASDADDESVAQLPYELNGVTINHSVAAREDTLGAKYNRAAALAPADAYIQHADDQVIETPGWDQHVRKALEAFEWHSDDAGSWYEPGLLYFGLGAGTMPANMVVNEAMRASLGYMFPPYFPQWWHETWLDEVGWLSGRILWIPEIATRGIAPENGGRGRTKSLRDLAFWAEFFQRTRPLRVAQAQAILDAGPDPAYRLAQLGHQATQLYGWFRDREAQFANPANNEGIMKIMAEPLEPGEAERLDRARAAAEALLKEKGL
jgi:glycosyltransferase involved in cell wall biosynthesis